jgi:hypothetical protein
MGHRGSHENLETRCYDATPIRNSSVLGRQISHLDKYVCSASRAGSSMYLSNTPHTDDANDMFWLAQIYYSNHQYSRAERLLTRPYSIITPNAPSRDIFQTPANGSISVKGKAKEPPLPVRLPMGHAAMLQVPDKMQDNVSRLVDLSVSCRYLAAQCLVWWTCYTRKTQWLTSLQMQNEQYNEAFEMVGQSNPFGGNAQDVNLDGGLKVEASMCLLRGNLMFKLNRPADAKVCYMEALAIDVKCFGALEQLTKCEMMTPKEGGQGLTSNSITYINNHGRMGFCRRSLVCYSNTRRCGIRAVDVYDQNEQV